MERIVLHMDIDYFFAQVEENDHPEYKGKPIVVCIYSGRDKTSGVVSTSNYEARKYNVKSGIPIKRAIQLLDGVKSIFLPARHKRYVEVSQGVMQILSKYGEKFEYASIDEGFLEITQAAQGNYANAEAIAKTLKKEIKDKFHLTCSIGIGPNKLIAKIGSDFNKPDGLTIVKPENVQEFLDPMEVEKIPGIGPKAKEALASLGIKTIGELRLTDPTKIVEMFGKKIGGWLVLAAKGIERSSIGNEGEQKGISRMLTLKRDTRDLEEIICAVQELINDIASEIKERELTFSSIGVNLIDKNLKTYAKSRTLSHPTQNKNEIKRIVKELFGEIISETDNVFRRAGIRVERLMSTKGQKTLFD